MPEGHNTTQVMANQGAHASSACFKTLSSTWLYISPYHCLISHGSLSSTWLYMSPYHCLISHGFLLSNLCSSLPVQVRRLQLRLQLTQLNAAERKPEVCVCVCVCVCLSERECAMVRSNAPACHFCLISPPSEPKSHLFSLTYCLIFSSLSFSWLMRASSLAILSSCSSCLSLRIRSSSACVQR